MKFVSHLLLVTTIVPALLSAQTRTPRVELTPTVGYVSSGSFSTSLGRLDLEDDIVYGGTLGFRAGPGRLVILNYSYFGTDLKLTDRFPIAPDTVLGGLDQHTITVGGEQEFKTGTARPFASGALGIVIFDSKVRGASGSSTRFSGNFALGVKVMSASDRVGLKLQGRVTYNSISSSGSFWCGTYGCGGGVTTAGIVQFEPSAGLVLAF